MVKDPRRERLKDILIRESLLRGDFLLASGQRSTFYLDVRRTSMHPEGAHLAAQLLLEALDDLTLGAVGGPAMGAIPLVGAMTAESFRRGKPLPAFIVRKEPKGHGTAKLIEGNFPTGGEVAIVEDVITTGGSVLRSIAVARGEGARVSRLVCVVDREQGGAEAIAAQGVDFVPLFRVSELLAATPA